LKVALSFDMAQPDEAYSDVGPDCLHVCWAKQYEDELYACKKSPARLRWQSHHEPASEDLRKAVAEQLYTQIQPWQTWFIPLHPGELGDPVICALQVAALVAGEGVGLDA
jgi:hypothetical protein